MVEKFVEFLTHTTFTPIEDDIMDKEFVQEKIDLTPEQEKAFRSLERAVKKCRKANIYFYQVLETLGALNGHNVAKIDNIENHRNINWGDSRDLNNLAYPYVKTADSWADGTHLGFMKGRRG